MKNAKLERRTFLAAGAATLAAPGLAAPAVAQSAKTATLKFVPQANLTLLDLECEWILGERGWESRSENCCFAGRTLHGRVLLTLAAGAVAHRDRSLALVSA